MLNVAHGSVEFYCGSARRSLLMGRWISMSVPLSRRRVLCRVGYLGWLALAWLISGPSVAAQEPASNAPAENLDSAWKTLGLPEPDPNAPYAKPPQLELLFDDDFTADTRGNYQISTEGRGIEWEPGKITLLDGGRLTRRIDGDNCLEIELDLLFPELVEDGQKSELRISLGLEPELGTYVILRETRSSGAIRSEVTVFGTPTPTTGEASTPSVPRRLYHERREGPFPSGAWRIKYHSGLWSIIAPGEVAPILVYHTLNYAKVLAATVRCTSGRVFLDSYRVHRVPVAAIEMNAEQLSRLELARHSIQHVIDLYNQGEYSQALPLAIESLKIRNELLGYHHSDSSLSRYGLAMVLDGLGRWAESEILLNMDVAEYKQLFPDGHPDLANALFNLSDIQQKLGRRAEAEQLQRETLRMRKRLFQGDHPHIAGSLNNLANLQSQLGKYVEANALYEQAYEMRVRLHGAESFEAALCLNNLAQTRSALGRDSEAESLFTESLRIQHEQASNENRLMAITLNNIALLRAKSDPDAAMPLFDQAHAMMTRLYPGDSEFVVDSLAILAFSRAAVGRHADALQLYGESLEMSRRVLGDNHPDQASQLSAIGRLLAVSGQVDAAEAKYAEALKLCLDDLEKSANYQSEVQQLQMVQSIQHRLEDFISLFADSSRPADVVYRYCLRWKGFVFAHQRLARMARESDDLETVKKLRELEAVASQLASLSLRVPAELKKQQTWRRQLSELQDQHERTEQELRSMSAEHLGLRQHANTGLSDLLATLKPDTLLVDIVRYNRGLDRNKDSEQQDYELGYCAFVLRPGKPVKLIPLGEVSRLDELIERWRTSIREVSQQERELAAELKKMVWEPLAADLDGVTTVLVAPEGLTAMIPWVALPGREADSFLLEEYSIVNIPVPHLVPELLSGSLENPQEAPSMLLLGDVDYGASPGRRESTVSSRSATVASSETGRNWLPLDDTRTEIVTIRDSFEQYFPAATVKVLRGGEATEQAFRKSASQHRFLHMATHGYLAPQTMKSALAMERDSILQLASDPGRVRAFGFHPGVLCGLVMTGANNEPQADCDDGILTALELGELDLRRVDCAVLSACSTGLGEAAGSEGLLGLQRAFQIAGARTTITSLWDVESRTTRELMIRFYANLYHKDATKRASSRIEALRRAQLELLSMPEFGRGGTDETTDQTSKLPPKFWAAWVLSGDWR